MKPKTTVVLLLISTFSVYFLCPVLCPSIGNQTCGVSNTEQPKSQGIDPVWQSSEHHTSSSTCCRTKASETTPDNDPGEENDICCFDRLEIFQTSEYPRTAQTLEQSFRSVVVIASRIEVNAFLTHSAVFLDRYPISYLDLPSYQISPRAPPSSLA